MSITWGNYLSVKLSDGQDSQKEPKYSSTIYIAEGKNPSESASKQYCFQSRFHRLLFFVVFFCQDTISDHKKILCNVFYSYIWLDIYMRSDQMWFWVHRDNCIVYKSDEKSFNILLMWCHNETKQLICFW